MKKVIVFTDTFFPFISGVATIVDSLTNALEKKGIKTSIVCPSPEVTLRSHSENDEIGRKIVRTPSMRLFKLYQDFRFPMKPPEVPYLVDDEETVFNVHSPFLSTAGALLTAVEIKKKMGIEIPIVNTFHTKIDFFSQTIAPYLPNSTLRFSMFMMRKLIDRTLITTVPYSPVEEYVKRRGVKRTINIRYPLSYKSFGDPSGSLQDSYPQLEPYKYFFMLGRISKEKRVEFLIKVFSDSQMPLVIGGKGPLLSHLRNKYEDEENIHLLGFIPDEHVNLLNKYATATVSAGYAEILATTLLEGMAQATPAIAFHVGGQTAYIEHGENGFLYKDKKGLLEKARKLFRNPEIRENMSNRAKKTANRYHPNNVIENWIRLFETSLAISRKYEIY